MIRKLLVPLLAAAALSGCVSDYYYRGQGGGDYYGDYYYGRPGANVYYGAPYSSLGYGYGGWYGGLGYGYGPRWGHGYRSYYGYPGYGYPGYGWPYYYYRPRPPHRPEHPDPPEAGDRVTGGNLPPRRRVAPQAVGPGYSGVERPPMIRGGGGQPLMRPRVDSAPQHRPAERLPSRPAMPRSTPRAVTRPAPRMTAPRAAPRSPERGPRQEE